MAKKKSTNPVKTVRAEIVDDDHQINEQPTPLEPDSTEEIISIKYPSNERRVFPPHS